LKTKCFLLAAIAVLVGLGSGLNVSPEKETLRVPGLRQPVEIVRDRWGIAHILAGNQNDLFLAQGFNVAADRLFQLEIWRRQATGTVAEILGPKALQADIGARLLRYRGDITQEMNFYHPRGEEIIRAFVRGINAYIDLTRKKTSLLPFEFRLLGLAPGYWTPEVVVSRHNGLFRNAGSEVELARAVHLAGPEKPKELLDFHPGDPDLKPAGGMALEGISDRVLELYQKARGPVRFGPGDLSPAAPLSARGAVSRPWLFPSVSIGEAGEAGGSNCWAVSGRLTSSGSPLLASDPHRALQIPSLRYWVHLSAPGWNVVGGGEPALPGVSIGHNENGAWGLTIFSADQEDLYVYDLNSDNPSQYRYQGRWEDMEIVREEIRVKGGEPFQARLKFTRHGPVVFEDIERRKAYALRAAWLQTGCAPYLSSLRTDQARSWGEFREAVFSNRTPSLNMIWAERSGDIGWQATGLTPVRATWPGLLPVPGDGRFEWSGFIPAAELPSFIIRLPAVATANEDKRRPGIRMPWAMSGRSCSVPRVVLEFLGSGRKMTLADMTALQQDFLSIPARRLVPLLKNLGSEDALSRSAWSFQELGLVLASTPAAAVIHGPGSNLTENLTVRLFPEGLQGYVPGKSLAKMIGWLEAPASRRELGSVASRDRLLLASLGQAAGLLKKTFGPEPELWRYGGEKFHYVRLRHTLSAALSPEARLELDLGPRPRGGDGETVNNTSHADNQESGATFRMVVDLADWDLTLGTNSPGQSGDPKSPHYGDLFGLWAEGRYFPVYFSRAKIKEAAEKILFLEPASQ
jgi:penicillin amidase